jgi:hypothetical protein
LALGALSAYLKTSSAGNATLRRYVEVVQAIAQMGQAPASQPRTQRCRRELTDAFQRLADEAQALARTLELDLWHGEGPPPVSKASDSTQRTL